MLATFLLILSVAFGRTAELCAKVDISYVDLGFGDAWTTDVDKPARGFFWEVWYTGMPPGYISPATKESYGWLDSGAPTPGCVTVPLTHDGGRYYFRIYSIAAVSGNFIWAYSDPTSSLLAMQQESTFVATTDRSFDVVLPGDTDDRWNHLALASWALHRHDGGMNETYKLYEGNSYTSETDQAALLGGASEHPERKFHTARKLGLLFSQYLDVNDNDGCRSGADDPLWSPPATDNCKGDTDPFRGPLTKTFMAEAGCNGMAMFYSAITWNDISPGGAEDCEYLDDLSYDWNLDTFIDAPSSIIKKCHGDPYGGFPSSDPDGSDWLETMVNGTSFPDCTTPLIERSTSYDWMTYFWDAVAQQDVLLMGVWDLWDLSDPADWNNTDIGVQPHEDIDDAALILDGTFPGFYSKHLDAADHGLDLFVH